LKYSSLFGSFVGVDIGRRGALVTRHDGGIPDLSYRPVSEMFISV